MTKLRTAALSDIGHLRTHNEDRYIQNDALGVYGVADGVGGLPGGEEAAQLAVDEIVRSVQAMPPGEPDLTTAVLKTNESVANLGHRMSPGMGIGTTLTFGVFRDGKVYLAHIGDSRCYVWHRGNFEALTRDHSVESDARLRRAKGEVVYYHQSNRNALTRCIGQPTPPEVDVLARTLKPGERYLFCSDGVTRLIRESELGELVARDAEPADVLKEIVELANRRGGPDNSTGILVYVDEAP
ncbi:MAG TPA: PP2C family serine/threonine-protein phosphatase [Opitutaceae bacterium]|nr:PP2C family serine/threonine-protein phosphatase [Opitutaceae bacterium]